MEKTQHDPNLLLFCESYTGVPQEQVVKILDGDPNYCESANDDEFGAVRKAAEVWRKCEENPDSDEPGIPWGIVAYRQHNDVEGGWTTMCFLGHKSGPQQQHCPECGIHKPQGWESEEESS